MRPFSDDESKISVEREPKVTDDLLNKSAHKLLKMIKTPRSKCGEEKEAKRSPQVGYKVQIGRDSRLSFSDKDESKS